MQAGLFLKLVDRTDLDQLVEQLYQRVFGMSREERRQKQHRNWPADDIDHAQYDRPTVERQGDRANTRGSDA